MLDFYQTSHFLRLALQFMAVIGLGAQMIHVVLHLYQPRWGGWLVTEKLLEAVAFVTVGAMAFLLAVVEFNASANIIVLLRVELPRYLLFAALLLLGGMTACQTQSPMPLIPAAAALLSLPLWEGYPVFVPFYALSILIFCLRGIVLSLRLGRTTKNSLSGFSVKEAVDSLPSAILFYQEDGSIILLNQTMLRLTDQLMGAQPRSGTMFYNALRDAAIKAGAQRYALDTSFVYELPDQSIWRFWRDELTIGRKRYYQLSAADITREWQLTTELERQKEKLGEQKEALLKMLNELEALSYQKELVRRKDFIHTVMGQRIAEVQNLLSKEAPDISTISESVKSMEQELQQGDVAASITFQQMARSFEGAGVKLALSAPLPEEGYGQLALDLIRECTINGVRHGLATAVEIDCRREKDSFLLVIRNNGSTAKAIREGGGIQAMRRRVERTGGRLEVETQPVFTVKAWMGGQGQ